MPGPSSYSTSTRRTLPSVCDNPQIIAIIRDHPSLAGRFSRMTQIKVKEDRSNVRHLWRVRISEWNQQRAHEHAFGDRSNACRLLTHVRKSRYLTCPQIPMYKIDRRFTCKHVRYNAVPMRITHSGALEVEGRIGRNLLRLRRPRRTRS